MTFSGSVALQVRKLKIPLNFEHPRPPERFSGGRFCTLALSTLICDQICDMIIYLGELRAGCHQVSPSPHTQRCLSLSVIRSNEYLSTSWRCCRNLFQVTWPSCAVRNNFSSSSSSLINLFLSLSAKMHISQILLPSSCCREQNCPVFALLTP